ncbi:hypothetical protein [Alkalicoccus luteus]|uniref:Uncharacterized protein n=1 Tax=Alkalicoccus luteus TaxID=1237094 RepID=A0A969PPH7_9BACI|nr:hypothetical protein [Alkalicoccus luteus]NJP37170.1 hypothetical protein [Alkalicoccus luteus]
MQKLIKRINTDLAELRRLTAAESEVDIYELYHGDQLIMVGSLNYLSKRTMYTVTTLKNYSYPKYLERVKDSPTATKVYKAGDRV